jgi:hypothetical protein
MLKVERLLALGAICLACWFLFPTETIPVSNGYGWDGSIYGRTTERLWQVLKGKELNQYYGCRVLPCVVARLLIDISGQPLTREVIIFTFRICNAILAVVGTFTWLGIAKQLRLTPQATTFGWIGLFINLFIGKMLSYYPVLTDGYALVFGLLLVRFSLLSNYRGIFLTSLAAGFTWPHAVTFGAILIAIIPCSSASSHYRNDLKFSTQKILTLAILCCAFIAINFSGKFFPEVGLLLGFKTNTARQFVAHIPDIAICSIALWKLVPLKYTQECFSRLLTRGQITYLTYSLALTIIHRMLLAQFTNPLLPPPSYLAPWYEVILIGSPSNGQIFNALVGNLFLTGPLSICAIIIWHHVCNAARSLNAGVVFGIICCLTSWLQAETRFVTLWYPFAVTATCAGLSTIRLATPSALTFFSCAAYFCGFWRKLNVESNDDTIARIPANQLIEYWYSIMDNYFRLYGGGSGFRLTDFLSYAIAVCIALIALRSAIRHDSRSATLSQEPKEDEAPGLCRHPTSNDS